MLKAFEEDELMKTMNRGIRKKTDSSNSLGEQRVGMSAMRFAFIVVALLLTINHLRAYPQQYQTSVTPQQVGVNDQTQTPIPGAGHDYHRLLGETVNYSNGSLNLKISFPVRQGRGISLPLKLTYNSGSVNQADTLGFSGNEPSWDDPISDPGPHGWDGEIPTRATVQLWSVNETDNGNTSNIYVPCNYQTGMTFTDLDGVAHNLYVYALSPASQPPPTPSPNTIYTCFETFTEPPTGDGQVIATINPAQAEVNLTNNNSSNFPATSFYVTDKSGTSYFFQPTTEYPNGSSGYFLPSSIEDRNGNLISLSSNLDTLGLPISSDSASGSTQTLTVNGLTFTETWGTENVNYNVAIKGGSTLNGWNCQAWPGNSPGTSVVSGSRGILSSLLLPNNQNYTFYYGTNNPTDSSVLNNFGLLNEVIYPDGGWIKYSWVLPPPNPRTESQYNEAISFGATQTYINQQTEQASYLQTSYGCVWQYQAPVLSERQVSFDGKTVAQTQKFTYDTFWQYGSNGISNGWTQKVTNVTTIDNLRGGISSKTVYTYSPYGAPAQQFVSGVNANLLPLENTITYYDWGQTTELKSVQKKWLDQFNLASQTTTYYTAGGTRTSGTFYKYVSGLCTNILLLYNSSKNISTDPVNSLVYLSEQDDYDYGNGQLGPLMKKTLYSYNCFQPPFPNSGPPVATLPPQIASITVEDGGGVIQAATQYRYDEFPLTNLTTSPTQHDSSYVSGLTVRGNLTSAIKCNPLPSSPTATCTGPTTHYTYDYSGQPSSMTDPNSNTTTYSFTGPSDVSNTNAYIMNITYPDQLSKNFTYNYTLGYVTSVTDENLQSTTYLYNTNAACGGSPIDGLYRLGEVDYPDGGKTKYCYNDAALTTTKQVTLDAAGDTVASVAVNDGMAHTIQTQQTTDPDGTTIVDSAFDGEGQVLSASNPHRGTTSSSDGTTYHYYDALGRMIETKEQDGSIAQWSYGGMGETSSSVVPTPTYAGAQAGSIALSAHPGTWVDFKDENGNKWQRTSDVFGNLLEVMEPAGSAQAPSMETDYTYNTLNDLVSVVQFGGPSGSSGLRRRQFTYNSLSELTTAFNPETGIISYTYDLNGNVSTKTDARLVTTTYGYDSINRLLSKSYTNDSSGTPASCYQYNNSVDAANFTGGRLVNAWTQASQSCPSAPASYLTLRHILQFDKMGRLKGEQQSTLASQAAGKVYAPQYGYDLAGNLISSTDGTTPSLTTPGSPLTITSMYCGAGRVQAVTSNWSDSTHPAYLLSPNGSQSMGCNSTSTAQYAPFGGLLNATFGSGLTFIRAYDVKMRVSSEVDQGTGTRPATPGSATVTIIGAEQSQ